MANWQSPRGQKGQQEDRTRIESPQSSSNSSLSACLRMALLFRGVDCYAEGREKLEGTSGGIIMGQGEFLLHNNFGKLYIFS